MRYEERELLDSLFEGVIVFDEATSRIVDLNRRASELFKLSAEEALGLRFADLSANEPPCTEADGAAWFARAAAGAPQRFDWRARDRDGRLFWVGISLRRGTLAGAPRLVASVLDYGGRADELGAPTETDARMRTLFEDAPVAIMVNRAGRLFFTNRRCVELFGATSKAELHGRVTAELLAPEERLVMIDRLRRHLAGEVVPRVWESVGVRLDGARFPLQIASEDLAFHDGPAIVSFLTDITERKAAEAEARQNEHKFRAIFENAEEMFGLLDVEGRVLAANHSFLDGVGLTREELLGRPLGEVRWWSNDAERRKLDDALVAARAGRVVRFETRHEGEHREEVILDFSLKPIVGEGRVTFLLPEARDVTAARRAEEERAALARALQQTDRLEMVGRLAGGVAHDFNNLLTVIVGGVELLREQATKDEVEDAISDIASAADSAARLTRQLLSFTRRGVSRPTPTAVDQVVLRIAKLLGRLLGERHELRLDLRAGDRQVFVDPAQLEQCVMNLAVNARDAMPDGGVVRVSTRARPSVEVPGHEVVLSVADTGTGMTEEVKAHVFDLFFTTKAHGSGLGLSTVNDIVRSAGGTICVQSEPGTGTTFELCLPECSEARTTRDLTERLDATGTETIAFVEDVALLRERMAKELRRMGYDVVAFPSAEKLLRAVETGLAFAALVTDIVLPGLDGLKLAEELRRARPSLPVVFTTGYFGDASLEEGCMPPRSDLLLKPYRAEEVGRSLRALLDERPTP